MIQLRPILSFLLLALVIPPQQGRPEAAITERSVTIIAGKGLVVDSPVDIRRVAVSNSEIAEAIVATPREILVNGRAPGETSMVVWQQSGDRFVYNLTILRNGTRLEAVRREINNELPGQAIAVDFENDVPIVHGVASDLTSANRALALANTLGRPVNLLKVQVPKTDPQILLKIRFANVDRSASQALGINFFSNGAANTIGAITTQQFSPPKPANTQNGSQSSTATGFTLSDALNIFLFRPDLNLGATIEALATKNLLQILAEPNVLTLNERPASFLAGGEFPFPTLQGGGAGLGAVTIQFREFGIRLNFTPYVTPRGTIHLNVAPEVSSLDYANALTVQGYTIPALSTRRVNTEVELEDGQSFAIAGLLDNRVTQNFSKIPGLGDVPLFGKLFQSRQFTKSNTELLVVVTPEIVTPIPAGHAVPEVKMPAEFLLPNSTAAMRTPPLAVTGPAPERTTKTIPMEELMRSVQGAQPAETQPQSPSLQFVPMMVPSTQQPVPGQPTPGAQSAPPTADGGKK
ncbi:MAG: pilus assembly protein N-terminal domain-containing protein [Bryobacteraceae bacterium]